MIPMDFPLKVLDGLRIWLAAAQNAYLSLGAEPGFFAAPWVAGPPKCQGPNLNTLPYVRRGIEQIGR